MAGGVDMARGHAANIQPKTLGSAHTPEVPRVVLSVETDSRRARTMPRLIPAGKPNGALFPAPAPGMGDGKASPWSAAPVEVVDRRDLPSANLPVTAPAPVAPAEKKGGGWLRYAVVLMLLLLAAGVVRRVRMATASDPSGSPNRTIGVAPPLPPEATAEPTAAAAAARPRYQGGALPSGADPTADPSMDAADASVEELDASFEELDAALDPTVIAPARRAAPPPPKPTFKPLFELPHEKAPESP